MSSPWSGSGGGILSVSAPTAAFEVETLKTAQSLSSNKCYTTLVTPSEFFRGCVEYGDVFFLELIYQAYIAWKTSETNFKIILCLTLKENATLLYELPVARCLDVTANLTPGMRGCLIVVSCLVNRGANLWTKSWNSSDGIRQSLFWTLFLVLSLTVHTIIGVVSSGSMVKWV